MFIRNYIHIIEDIFMNLLENLENTVGNTVDNLSKLQEKFLESKLFDFVDNALNIGIKTALPDWIENDVIELKDNIIENGVIQGIKETVSSVIEIRKSNKGNTYRKL
jgi:hypothetical protein